MLKKNEVLEALENGGHITLNEIYRSATVYNANGERLDSCRYDTAERIGKTDGYTNKSAGAWTYTRHIEKDWDALAQRVQDATTAALQAFEEAGVISDLKVEPLPDNIQENKPVKEWKNYIVTLQDRYSAEIRTVTVSALNADHARIKGRGRADMFEFVAAVELEPTGQAKTDRDNRNHCRRIAEDLEAYAEGRVYRCPDCEELLELPEDVGDKYRCPDCGSVSNVDDLEQQGLYDYFSDCLGIEYRVSGRGTDDLRSVCVMVACGGPNIYIDTASKAVELYWWGDRASYPITSDAAAEVDAWAEEMCGCC